MRPPETVRSNAMSTSIPLVTQITSAPISFLQPGRVSTSDKTREPTSMELSLADFLSSFYFIFIVFILSLLCLKVVHYRFISVAFSSLQSA